MSQLVKWRMIKLKNISILTQNGNFMVGMGIFWLFTIICRHLPWLYVKYIRRGWKWHTACEKLF